MIAPKRRSRRVDTWPVVRECQRLAVRADGGRAVERLLASSRIGTPSLRKRIRRGIEAHAARGDRENFRANLHLAVPARIAPRWLRWYRRVWQLLPLGVGIATGVSSRSVYVGACIYGWMVLVGLLGWIVIRMTRRSTRAALDELDRIRIMVTYDDPAAALALWRKLAGRDRTSRVTADVIADAACAIEELGGDSLSRADLAEVAGGLRELLPRLSKDCRADASAAAHRLEQRANRPVLS